MMLLYLFVAVVLISIFVFFFLSYILPSSTPTESLPVLYKRVSHFYDATSKMWEEVWGDQLHHGYYGKDGKDQKTDYQAQIDMIEELLKFGGFHSYYETAKKSNLLPIRLLDVGCGVGGSSHYISRTYPGVHCSGITLSPYQAKSATERAEKQGVGKVCDFQVANALETPFKSNTFDIIYSMESGEHMPNKQIWYSEIARIIKPKGLLLMATWCHRKLGNQGIEAEDDINQIKLSKGEPIIEPKSSSPTIRGPLSSSELAHLNRIRHNYALPEWVSIEEYVKVSRGLGFEEIKTDDWTQATAPFWPAVLKSSLTLKSVMLVLGVGWTAIKSLFTAYLMITGFNRGLLKFVVFAAKKK